MTRVRLSALVDVGACIELDDAQAYHLRVVLRLRAGERLEVIDADGQMWQAQVTDGQRMRVQILGRDTSPSADPRACLEVWLPLLKGGKTDDLVRQLTEIGASELVCYTAERSVARLQSLKVDKRIARWRSIISEATRQCARRKLPQLRFSNTLPGDGPGVYLWEKEGEQAAFVMKSAVSEGKLRVLIGPEGGLSEGEAAHLNAQGWRALHLGARILRAETAVLVGATLGLAALGEEGYSQLP